MNLWLSVCRKLFLVMLGVCFLSLMSVVEGGLCGFFLKWFDIL